MSDDKLEGIGWDGEYIKKGVRGQALGLGDLRMDKEELAEWVTEVFHCIDGI